MTILLWCAITFSIFFAALLLPKQLISGVETLAKWVSGFFKQDFSAYVDLEGKVSDFTFMRKDGSLVTMIEFAGASQIVGNEEFREMAQNVDQFFARQMNDKGHDMQVVYRQDSNNAGMAVRNALTRSRATAERIGLSITDILDAEEEILGKVVVDESIWIVVSTSPIALNNPEVIKAEQKEKIEKAIAMKLPGLGFAQNPLRIIEELIPKHDAFLGEVIALFNQPGKSSAFVMDCHEVMSAIRHEIQPLSTDVNYRACLPGDTPPMSGRNHGVRPWEDMYYPPVWSQACNVGIGESYAAGMERVLIDGMYHGTVAMDLPPQQHDKFELLMKKLRNTPFRISYRIYSSGMDRFSMNYKLVQFLSFNPKSDNRSIKNAIEAIMARAKGSEESGGVDPALGLSVVITTWHEDEKKLLRNMQMISRAMQGWGGCDVLTGAGDATDLFVSSIPALSSSTPARYMLQNGSDIARILPLSRPAAAWKDGSIIFTSTDGKMLPFQPGSSIQNAWVYLVFATMGSGKSVLLNTIELGMCLAPGLKKLPMMTILDVGESVSGTISIVQSSLPDDRKGEAGYFKIKMSAEYAYNVFDLQLGFSMPHARDRDFLRNFLSMIATPAGREKPASMMSELMGMVVDEAYRQKSADGNPNKYQSGVDEEIDRVIDVLGIRIDSSTTWREITDDLFKFNRVDDAIRAQRYAVPTLQVIPSVMKSSAIGDVFGRTSEGRELIETAFIMINSAIRDFTILAMPTRWDIGSCRVVGIDLNDVKGHGDSGAKQTALMYAFAQQSAARNYYMHPDILEICPEAYRDYHRGRIEEIMSEVKAIVYDEFHNTKGIEGIRKIVSIDIREGRKWNIMTVLSSQLIEDFDQDAIDNMTGTFILSASNEGVVEKCRKVFGRSDSAVHALRTEVVRPGTGMAIFNTKHGRNTQIFKNHLSPIKMWGFTTTAEDKMLRRFLYDVMPAPEARKALANRFPGSGQFKLYVEQQRNNMMSSDDDGNVIRVVADEMISEWHGNKSIKSDAQSTTPA
jgi:intracellular multiplication protein IcmB